MNNTSLITNHADGEGTVSRNGKIKIEGVKILKKFVKASGIFAAAGFPLDLASKINTDTRFARHFQGFSEVEIDAFDSLTKKDKDDKEGGALAELEKYVRCKFV